MTPSTVNFDKRTITEVLFCALLMSAIDKEIHIKEWEVIQVFLNQYWKREFGNFKDLQKVIIKELGMLLKDSRQLKQRLNHLFDWLAEHLSMMQKQIVLDLVSQVMAADNRIAPEESSLFSEFLKVLGLQQKQ